MIWRWPVFLMGSSSGLITSWNVKASTEVVQTSFKFSETVWPVHVTHVPSKYPRSRRYFMSAGVPPTLWRSSMTYLPEGFKSARSGVASETRWKSSNVRSTSTERAMAIMCSTALVEPPVTMIIVRAFSKAALVMMSFGLRSRSSSVRMALPARRHSSTFSGESAGELDEYGSDMPSASMAVAIVLAVYMPPHAPRPGHAFRTTACRSSSEILPYAYSP
mmetsp:Transcript_19236/g.59337  ORF Transcript_19236/g.59337 Transcript_19236/m.59337 type:complete len:219 (-) Transcript_19236:664-1320(-)